jgi:O-antigen biosynthesis alpha-1,2-mannosyltransferase
VHVLFDVRGAQTDFHPERGIPRYIAGHVAALAEAPQITRLECLIEPGLSVPPAIERAASRLVMTTDVETLAEGPLIFHLGSIFETDWAYDDLVLPPLRRPEVTVATTFYDALPVVNPETFVAWTCEPWYRRWCQYRADVIRLSDVVLAISQFAAAEAIRTLEIPPERMHVIGSGLTPIEPASPDALRVAASQVQAPYVLYSGGTEHPRKNLPTLIAAFSQLPAHVIETHQLVIASRIDDSIRAILTRKAEAAGVAEQLVFTGYVPDDVLWGLYRDCACFVYPSLYEGLGLPIVEAMACGAPVIASSTTGCGDTLGFEDAEFDPTDSGDVARRLERVLTDEAFARALRAHGSRRAAGHAWSGVAERTVAAYSRALGASGSTAAPQATSLR